jgi:hypothetical protein
MHQACHRAGHPRRRRNRLKNKMYLFWSPDRVWLAESKGCDPSRDRSMRDISMREKRGKDLVAGFDGSLRVESSHLHGKG